MCNLYKGNKIIIFIWFCYSCDVNGIYIIFFKYFFLYHITKFYCKLYLFIMYLFIVSFIS